MKLRAVTPHIFYAGVNDRNTDRFENLWPLPYGVSYNSYLVKGNSGIALIDSVETSHTMEFIASLKSTIGESPIDYLVVNHMEPDHSGAIPAILKEYPDLTIIGNNVTISMVKGFYGIEDPDKFKEIKNDTTISLGDVSLRFITTPMVHWPETMMTYVPEEKTLFSGDAFGCFGALNGGIIDADLETSVYFEEMYRYYSNIVGKYGKFVQKALEKTAWLELGYICSTHGPVWHESIEKVVDIYNRLSNYEPEPGVTIIYGSMYGNTEMIAEAIAERLSTRGVRNIKIHNAAKSDLSHMISDAFRYKGLIVGCPTYSGHLFPPVEQFMIAMETREIKNKVLGLFSSFTWASASMEKLKEYAALMKQDAVYTLDVKQAPGENDFTEAFKLADLVADAMGLQTDVIRL